MGSQVNQNIQNKIPVYPLVNLSDWLAILDYNHAVSKMWTNNSPINRHRSYWIQQNTRPLLFHPTKLPIRCNGATSGPISDSTTTGIVKNQSSFSKTYNIKIIQFQNEKAILILAMLPVLAAFGQHPSDPKAGFGTCSDSWQTAMKV